MCRHWIWILCLNLLATEICATFLNFAFRMVFDLSYNAKKFRILLDFASFSPGYEESLSFVTDGRATFTLLDKEQGEKSRKCVAYKFATLEQTMAISHSMRVRSQILMIQVHFLVLHLSD